jgi:subtilisin family serine protease
MTHARSGLRLRLSLALVGATVLLAALVPSSFAAIGINQRYVVVLKGGYALNGEYALGQGYALVTQETTYALDGTYALGRQYALYALNRTYALADQYALTDEYALAENYALFGQYALDSGYALGRNYALGSGYALAAQTGTYALDGSYALTDNTAGYALGSKYALLDGYALDKNYALARDYALYLISTAGGVVTSDLTRQAGVMMVESRNDTFAQTMRQYALVQEVGQDFGWNQFPTFQQAVNSGQLLVVNNGGVSTNGVDPLESQQWSMQQIHAPQAQARQLGRSNVQVGIVDTGIDGNHQDFVLNGKSNVDCARGADFTFSGPGIGSPLACVDNNFHGTHTAGTIGARRNGIGVVGVAPNVTLVPIKVCDGDGHCYVSDAVEGITYAGDLGLDVINMSFYVDDDTFQESTEFKCQSQPTQRAYREAVQRALKYARHEGVSLVAAVGNEDTDLAHQTGGKKCKAVPVQAPDVIGTSAVGPKSEKASYSNWGAPWVDVAAPGGNETVAEGQCASEVLSTLPGNAYGCIQGTSMASPHTAGVVALIISQFGKSDGNGGWSLAPDKVNKRLLKSVIDIGVTGRDKCFGAGRIDALRAVSGTTKYAYDATAPRCNE